MNVLAWAGIITAYPFLLALIIVWLDGATRFRDPEPAPALSPEPAVSRRSTMKVEVFGVEVSRFEILEHVAPDGEILEFHVPPAETRFDWTIDQVANLVAAIDRLPQAPELEKL